VREVQVHDHHVRPGPRRQGHPVIDGGRVADDANPLLFQQFAQATPEQVVVVDDKRTDGGPRYDL
jgi:hypothetical protein